MLKWINKAKVMDQIQKNLLIGKFDLNDIPYDIFLQVCPPNYVLL